MSITKPQETGSYFWKLEGPGGPSVIEALGDANITQDMVRSLKTDDIDKIVSLHMDENNYRDWLRRNIAKLRGLDVMTNDEIFKSLHLTDELIRAMPHDALMTCINQFPGTDSRRAELLPAMYVIKLKDKTQSSATLQAPDSAALLISKQYNQLLNPWTKDYEKWLTIFKRIKDAKTADMQPLYVSSAKAGTMSGDEVVMCSGLHTDLLLPALILHVDPQQRLQFYNWHIAHQAGDAFLQQYGQYIQSLTWPLFPHVGTDLQGLNIRALREFMAQTNVTGGAAPSGKARKPFTPTTLTKSQNPIGAGFIQVAQYGDNVYGVDVTKIEDAFAQLSSRVDSLAARQQDTQPRQNNRGGGGRGGSGRGGSGTGDRGRARGRGGGRGRRYPYGGSDESVEVKDDAADDDTNVTPGQKPSDF